MCSFYESFHKGLNFLLRIISLQYYVRINSKNKTKNKYNVPAD